LRRACEDKSVGCWPGYAPEPNPETKKKDVVWFDDDRPLVAFAGIWTEFKGERGTKSKPVPGPHLVYGFLTTSPNAVVEPIHPKAMPVTRVVFKTLANSHLPQGVRSGLGSRHPANAYQRPSRLRAARRA
jgi:hypothetical protein